MAGSTGIGITYSTYRQRTSAPNAPGANYVRLYFKTDGKLYYIDSNGTEKAWDPTAVAITGGTIDGATVGVTTPAAGNFTTIGATTPGAVYSVSQVTTHSATESATAASMYGNEHLVTGAYTVTLPTAVLGMSATFESTTAAAFSLDCAGTDAFILGGTTLTAGYKITSDAAAGNKVRVVCKQATKWHVVDVTGAFVDGGA